MKVAVTGLGFMGLTHISALLKLEGVEIAAVCDSHEERLNLSNLKVEGNLQTVDISLENRGIRTYTDYDQMLSDGGFDFVDICLPTFLHASFSIKAMEAGYHVFCEKPLSLEPEEGRRMMEKAEETGRILGVGHCLRFWPGWVEVRELIESGRYGKVTAAHLSRLSAMPVWSDGGWMLDYEKSGGPVLDLHIHDADMVRYLFGNPLSLRSTGTVDSKGRVSFITTVYDYGDGPAVSSTGGFVPSGSFPFDATAFFNLERAAIKMGEVIKIYPDGEEPYTLEIAPEDGYYWELKDFVSCVKEVRPSRVVSPRDAVKSIELCQAELLSVLEKREMVF